MSWFEIVSFPNAIHRLSEPGLGPLDACQSWLVVGKRAALLIDAGTGVAPLKPVVETITRLPVILLMTHSHFDHIGGAHEFSDRRALQAESAIFADPTPEATLWGGWLTEASFARKPGPDFDFARYGIAPAPVTRFVETGSRIDLGGRTLEVRHAPGHSPGLLAVFEPATRTLFSSDALYDGPMFFDLPGSDRREGRASIEALAEWRPAVVHPGHFASFGEDRLSEVVERGMRQTES